jgi:hypothetical protein
LILSLKVMISSTTPFLDTPLSYMSDMICVV